jgi:hypothetical protein
MKVKFFNYWKQSKELELNIHFGGNVCEPKNSRKSYDFRIGTHQWAFWINHKPIIDIALQSRVNR